MIFAAITITAILTLTLYLGAVKWQRTYRDDLMLTCLDVGHGQTIMAQLPGNHNILFDAGSLHRRDIGTQIVAPYLEHGTFMMTWGDGLSDVNLRDLLAFHRSHGKLATLTAVRPPARYGYLDMEGSRVMEFSEKSQLKEGWINGAYFVLETQVLDYIDGDHTQWEKEPLERLVADGQLMAFRHTSFWQCMDTLREKYILEKLWQSGEAPWKIWG